MDDCAYDGSIQVVAEKRLLSYRLLITSHSRRLCHMLLPLLTLSFQTVLGPLIKA